MQMIFAKLMVFIGIVSLAVALGFGLISSQGQLGAPQLYSSAGAAPGFAVAGGLCFVAAAIAIRNDGRGSEP